MNWSLIRLRIADFFLTVAYFVAPRDWEGGQMRRAIGEYNPPWDCHYLCKGGWNVKLRDDCPHPRYPDGSK